MIRVIALISTAFIICSVGAVSAQQTDLKTYIKNGGMCNQLETKAECIRCARRKGYPASQYMNERNCGPKK